MSNVANLTLVSTNAEAFRASGEAAHLERWLREVRHDMSREACRQVVSHARRFLDIFGDAAPSLVAGPPERIRARLDAIDLHQHGLARHRYRALLRAGMAMYAAVYDLDASEARSVMDRRTPQCRPESQRNHQENAPAPYGDLLDHAAVPETPTADRASADTTVPVDPARLPRAVRPVIEAVNNTLTAQIALDDAIDVTDATRCVVRRLSPAARVRIASALPEAAQVPVTLSTASTAPTLARLAEDVIVTVITERYADLRP